MERITLLYEISTIPVQLTKLKMNHCHIVILREEYTMLSSTVKNLLSPSFYRSGTSSQ